MPRIKDKTVGAAVGALCGALLFVLCVGVWLAFSLIETGFQWMGVAAATIAWMSWWGYVLAEGD